MLLCESNPESRLYTIESIDTTDRIFVCFGINLGLRDIDATDVDSS